MAVKSAASCGCSGSHLLLLVHLLLLLWGWEGFGADARGSHAALLLLLLLLLSHGGLQVLFVLLRIILALHRRHLLLLQGAGLLLHCQICLIVLLAGSKWCRTIKGMDAGPSQVCGFLCLGRMVQKLCGVCSELWKNEGFFWFLPKNNSAVFLSMKVV